MRYPNTVQLRQWLIEKGLHAVAHRTDFDLNDDDYAKHLKVLENGVRPKSEHLDAAALLCITANIRTFATSKDKRLDDHEKELAALRESLAFCIQEVTGLKSAHHQAQRWAAENAITRDQLMLFARRAAWLVAGILLLVLIAAIAAHAHPSTISAGVQKVAIVDTSGNTISATSDPCDGARGTTVAVSLTTATAIIAALASNYNHICSGPLVNGGASDIRDQLMLSARRDAWLVAGILLLVLIAVIAATPTHGLYDRQPRDW